MSFFSDFFGSGPSAPTPAPQSTYDPAGAMGLRTQAAQSLQDLLSSGGSSVFSSPLYQNTLQAGMNAIQGQNLAQGQGFSSGEKAALLNYGSGMFSNVYNQLANQYGAISGATSQTPAGATSAAYSNALQGAYYGYNQSTDALSTLGGLVGGFGGIKLPSGNTVGSSLSNWIGGGLASLF